MKQNFPYSIIRIYYLSLGYASDSLNSTQYEAMYVFKLDVQGCIRRNATAVQDLKSIKDLLCPLALVHSVCPYQVNKNDLAAHKKYLSRMLDSTRERSCFLFMH